MYVQHTGKRFAQTIKKEGLMKLYEFNKPTSTFVETTLQAGDCFESDIEEGTIIIVRKKENGKVLTLHFSPKSGDYQKPFPIVMASKFREICEGMVDHLGFKCKQPTAWYYKGKPEIRGYTCELEKIETPS